MTTKPVQYISATGKLLGGKSLVVAKLSQVGAKPKASKAPKQSYHRGFVVQGYEKGSIAKAEREHNSSRTAWLAMTQDQMNKATSLGKREPKPWDLQTWLRGHAPTRLRRRPFESHEAALDCRAMAEREGWERVEIVEQKKGQPDPNSLF